MTTHWIELLLAIAAAMNLEWRVPATVVEIESGWDPAAVSSVGAVGLMQVMPREAGECFRDRPPARLLLKPAVNLIIGCSILRENLHYFDGDYRRALAAYHLGIAGLERRGLDDEAAARYLRRFEEAWGRLWPETPLPWEGADGTEANQHAAAN